MTQILFNKPHLQVEYLLLKLAEGMLRPLAPCHHVAQVSDLRTQERCSPLYSWTVACGGCNQDRGCCCCPLCCLQHPGTGSQALGTALARDHMLLIQS